MSGSQIGNLVASVFLVGFGVLLALNVGGRTEAGIRQAGKIPFPLNRIWPWSWVAAKPLDDQVRMGVRILRFVGIGLVLGGLADVVMVLAGRS